MPPHFTSSKDFAHTSTADLHIFSRLPQQEIPVLNLQLDITY
jgi:hypothetical protein